MDEHDKIYLWLVVVSLIALLVGIGFGWAEIADINGTVLK